MTDRLGKDEETSVAPEERRTQSNIAVSPEEQIALVEHKRRLAQARYDLLVRRGRAWVHIEPHSN